MTLYGDKGDTGIRKLDSSQNDFERGKVCDLEVNRDTIHSSLQGQGRIRQAQHACRRSPSEMLLYEISCSTKAHDLML
jgi:hypothetical protein